MIMMRWIVAIVLLTELVGISYFLGYIALGKTPWLSGELQTVSACILFGGLGGCVYCLRAVYMNCCVHKSWDNDWVIWYFIRPFVSLVLGGVSYLLIKAGLILIGSSLQSGGSQPGLWTLTFLAGLNVDKFITKMEDIGQSAWGIEPSRQSKPKN
jgi:hypothetical protein